MAATLALKNDRAPWLSTDDPVKAFWTTSGRETLSKLVRSKELAVIAHDVLEESGVPEELTVFFAIKKMPIRASAKQRPR